MTVSIDRIHPECFYHGNIFALNSSSSYAISLIINPLIYPQNLWVLHYCPSDLVMGWVHPWVGFVRIFFNFLVGWVGLGGDLTA